MTEAEFQRQVIELAQYQGWRVAHFRPARTAKGWATPVQADGAGFPDLVLVRSEQLIFAELKSEKGRLSEAQKLWLGEFNAVEDMNESVRARVWRPSDWEEIVEALRHAR